MLKTDLLCSAELVQRVAAFINSSIRAEADIMVHVLLRALSAPQLPNTIRYSPESAPTSKVSCILTIIHTHEFSDSQESGSRAFTVGHRSQRTCSTTHTESMGCVFENKGRVIRLDISDRTFSPVNSLITCGAPRTVIHI
jgi:hypothetical protein